MDSPTPSASLGDVSPVTDLRKAILEILSANPELRMERIRINGDCGIKAMLTARGVVRSGVAIRAQLNALGLKTSGRGHFVGNVRSREQIDRIVHREVSAHTEWRTDGVKIRGASGLKTILKAQGISINQVTLGKCLHRLGYKTKVRGFVRREDPQPVSAAA